MYDIQSGSAPRNDYSADIFAMASSHYNHAAALNPECIVTTLPAGLLSTDMPGTEAGCCQKQPNLPYAPQDKTLKGDVFIALLIP